MSANLILASGSTVRAQMLRSAGIDMTIAKSNVDEAEIKASLLADGASPRDIADSLAEAKARKVSLKHPSSLVLGCDQVLVCEKALFDKAETISEAREQLLSLRGKAHELLSAAVIYENANPVWRYIGRAQLVMRDFTDQFLETYVSNHGDDLLTTVGCYKLEEDGPTLFSRVQGDYFSVLGLPLLEVLGFLRTRGIAQE